MLNKQELNLEDQKNKVKGFFQKYGTPKNLYTGVGILSVAGLVGYGYKSGAFNDIVGYVKDNFMKKTDVVSANAGEF
jgi:hypothetical protein